MNWTAFPFFRNALAMALVLIPGAFSMSACKTNVRLTGGSDSTAAVEVGGAGGNAGGGGVGGTGNLDDLCFIENTCETGKGGSGASGMSIETWSKHFGNDYWSFGGTHDLTAKDSAGNVAISGNFKGDVDFGGGLLTSQTIDIFVTKFDPNGNHLWSKLFSGGYSSSNAMAFDSAGNMVITGYSEGNVDYGGGPITGVGSRDIFVAKLDPNGNHLWSKRFGDAGNSRSNTMAIDNAGNVVIAGAFEDTVNFGGGPLTTGGSYVAKLDPNGNHLWSKRFGDVGKQFLNATAIDSAGNVVIAGAIHGTVDVGGGPLTTAGGGDVFMAKMDPNGNHLWSKRFGDVGDQVSDAMAIDSTGNVVIAGAFEGAVNFGGGPFASTGETDIFTAKFDPNGNHLWSKRFESANSNSFVADMAIDSAGNTVIAGEFVIQVDFGGGPLTTLYLEDSDIFLAKLDPNGNHLWSFDFGDTSSQGASGVTVDDVGSVMITGLFNGSVDFGNGPHVDLGFSKNVFLAKLKP